MTPSGCKREGRAISTDFAGVALSLGCKFAGVNVRRHEGAGAAGQRTNARATGPSHRPQSADIRPACHHSRMCENRRATLANLRAVRTVGACHLKKLRELSSGRFRECRRAASSVIEWRHWANSVLSTERGCRSLGVLSRTFWAEAISARYLSAWR